MAARAQQRARGPKRPSIFGMAIGASLLFHLSAVTLFDVVIYFPRERIAFYDFQIVEEAAVSGLAPVPVASPDLLSLAKKNLFGDPLPDIDLPTLEFAELSRIQTRQEGLRSRSLYGEIMREDSPDSWARFGKTLQRLGKSVTGISLSLSHRETPGLRLDEDLDEPVARPAEGFEASIQWNAGPKDRALLFAPPIQALWHVSPLSLQGPIELVLQLSPDGRVINVWSPNVDESGLTDEVQLAVLQYRFDPLPVGTVDAGVSTATLRIRPARETP